MFPFTKSPESLLKINFSDVIIFRPQEQRKTGKAVCETCSEMLFMNTRSYSKIQQLTRICFLVQRVKGCFSIIFKNEIAMIQSNITWSQLNWHKLMQIFLQCTKPSIPADVIFIPTRKGILLLEYQRYLKSYIFSVQKPLQVHKSRYLVTLPRWAVLSGEPPDCFCYFCCPLRFNFFAVIKGSEQPNRNHVVLKQREADRTRGKEGSTFEKETPPNLSVSLLFYDHTHKQRVISQLCMWSGHHFQEERKATAWPVACSLLWWSK